MEQEIIEPVKAPLYVLRFSQDGKTEVLAKVSSEALGQLVVAALPCGDDQSIELFQQDEFTRTLEPGECWG